MANVQMPDGSVVAFPDGMSDSDINNVLAGQNQPATGIMANIGNDWSARKNDIIDSFAKSGDLSQGSPIEAGLHVAGNLAGGAFDIPQEAAKSALGSAPQNIANAIDTTPTGQKLGDLLMGSKNAISDTANSYPRAAGDVSMLANLLGAGSAEEPLKTTSSTIAKPITAMGNALYDSGKASQDAAHQSYVQDLVLPKQTPTVKADMALRTKQVDGTNIYQPTPQEAQMIDTVGQIPGISRNNSLQKNLNLIQDANTQEAQSLKAKLQANDVPIADDVALNSLQNIRNTLPQSTAINGPGIPIIEKVVNAATTHLANNSPLTASSMLQARKDFDSQMLKEGGQGVFDTTVEAPRKMAIQAVRQSMNGMISDAVPQLNVLPSLQKQSNLFEAADNIAPKAAGESPTALGRTLQKWTPHSISDVAGSAGVLGAGGAAIHYLPPSALGSALAGYGLYKGATAPATRMMLGKALGGG